MNLRKWSVLLLLLVVLSGCAQQKHVPLSYPPTAQFIARYFIDNTNIQTDLTTNQQLYLSESVGLWLQFLLNMNDEQIFEQHSKHLNAHFVLPSGLISWQIDNGKASQTNALIDDFRIMTALYDAANVWGKRSYEKQADSLAESIVLHQLKGDYFVDFYDGTEATDFITLSYLDPRALNYLKTQQLISNSVYEANAMLLTNLKTAHGWFPQRYYVLTDQFEYEDTINLIDQYYISYHRAMLGIKSDELVQYTKRQMQIEGKLYGRVAASTHQRLVDYESPAVYALAYLTMKHLEEESIAQQLLDAMYKLQVTDSSNDYYGGYIDVNTLETHFFDNILPVLAEEYAYE